MLVRCVTFAFDPEGKATCVGTAAKLATTTQYESTMEMYL
jgi:hypothetical protein